MASVHQLTVRAVRVCAAAQPASPPGTTNTNTIAPHTITHTRHQCRHSDTLSAYCKPAGRLALSWAAGARALVVMPTPSTPALLLAPGARPSTSALRKVPNPPEATPGAAGAKASGPALIATGPLSPGCCGATTPGGNADGDGVRGAAMLACTWPFSCVISCVCNTGATMEQCGNTG